ncbi:MAG: HDOD domain-containing protein [Planctomycetaceae bacterium]|nr:HDOD domain-containing protein [Planctomycetaceae bacterium]
MVEMTEPVISLVKDSGATLKRHPPRPEMFNLPSRYELQRLMLLLRDEDLEIRSFVAELRRNTGLVQFLKATANSRLTSDEHYITDPGHAVVMLGMRQTHDLLSQLVSATVDRKAA